jgi:hypothetical protein
MNRQTRELAVLGILAAFSTMLAWILVTGEVGIDTANSDCVRWLAELAPMATTSCRN